MKPDAARVETVWGRLRAVLPYAATIGLFALGLYAISRLLSEVDLNDVLRQVHETPLSILILSWLATVGGYLCLVGYDWSALRYIGKPLPLPITVTGGLMAYAFGNTVGLAAVSGGAVRYRLYSSLGLDGYDIAAVSTFTAVSYGTAAALVGFVALVVDPGLLGALSPLPPHLLRWAALGAILVVLVPLVWASATRKSLRIRRFTLRAPSLPILIGQALFSIGDISLASLALYVLLPSGHLDVVAFLGIYAAATMAGIMSHVPGGVGVFETVVLASLPASIPVDQAAAALLLFRLIYFIVPFLLALVVLALFEALVVVRGAAGKAPGGMVGRALAALAPTLSALSPMAPILLATMIFGSGLWMSFSSLIPPDAHAPEALETLFPLVFLEAGALLSSILGAVLIIVALGVARRSLGAYWLAIAAMAGGSLLSLVQMWDVKRAMTLALAAVILLPFRREFNRRASLVHGAFSPIWFALVVGLVLSAAFVIDFGHKNAPYAGEIWWQFAANAGAPRAARAGLVLAVTVLLASLALLLRVPHLSPATPTSDELRKARRIIEAQDDPDAALALTGDKSLMFSDDGRGFIMYGVHGRSWIALGGPVGPRDCAAELGWAFVDAARRAGARPVFYEVGGPDLPLMLDLGLALHKLGERAMVDLTQFTLEGPQQKRLRDAYHHGQKEGLALQIVEPPHAPDLIRRLRMISDDWLTTKNTREKQFSVGRFDPDWLQNGPLVLVTEGDGRIVAFANLLLTPSRQVATVDLMRHPHDAPTGVMDFLFIALMLALKAEGYARFSMGMAPLSGMEARRGTRLWNRFGAALFHHGGHFYNFSGLRDFKAKFHPEWESRYLAVPQRAAPLAPIADATMLIGGGSRGVIGH